MNIIRKKCMFITPNNIVFKLSNGKELKPNTKTVDFAWTKEILNAINCGIRVHEIGSDGKMVAIDKYNFDKINVLMDYNTDVYEEEEATPEAVEEPTPVAASVEPEKVEETPVEEPAETTEPEEVEDPAETESPSEDDVEEEEAPEELDDTPQPDPEDKYYKEDSEDDCDEEKEDTEDDEFNVD